MTFIESYEISNQEKYELAKNNFLNSIEQQTQTIVLFGSGSNGKSHLTNELNAIIEDNGYSIHNTYNSYSWDQTHFLQNAESPEKKIIHLLFDPFQKWDIQPTTEISLINMDDIRW